MPRIKRAFRLGNGEINMKRTVIFFVAICMTFSALALNARRSTKSGTGDIMPEDRADMSAYETYDADEDYVFVKSNIKDMHERSGRKETFVIYFGFAKCPWCRDLMPVLNEASKMTGHGKVYYANTRENPEWKSNIEMDDYDLLVEMASDYLEYDEKGIKHLDAPTVYFVKDGKIHTAVFAPKYDAHKERISDELKKALLDELVAAFKSLR